MIRVKTIILLCLFISKAATALSWGVTGHRIIGEIAESQLTGKAKARINAILDNASVAMVANWGDEVRSDPAYNYTANWHYTNLDGGLTRAEFDTLALRKDAGQNIFSVATLTEHLRQTPNDTAMLKMLIHLVGDMHCPLHLGRADDRGGNSIRIKWFGSSTNLHSLWDSALIDSQKLSYTEYTTHLTRIYPIHAEPFDGNPHTILDWAWTIYHRTELIYATSKETSKPYVYIYNYKPLWEKSLVEAAEHLAALLNYIYK
jgi:hypothetical protein